MERGRGALPSRIQARSRSPLKRNASPRKETTALALPHVAGLGPGTASCRHRRKLCRSDTGWDLPRRRHPARARQQAHLGLPAGSVLLLESFWCPLCRGSGREAGVPPPSRQAFYSPTSFDLQRLPLPAGHCGLRSASAAEEVPLTKIPSPERLATVNADRVAGEAPQGGEAAQSLPIR